MAVIISRPGTALPDHSISQQDAAVLASGFCCQTDQQQRLLPVLYRRAGVQTRHSVILNSGDHSLPERQSFYPPADSTEDRGPSTADRMQQYESAASVLAHAASVEALSSAGLDATAITHLVTVSCSGFHAPGFDISLFGSLGLRRDVQRTHVGFMGCHGALNAIRVARSFVESQPSAVVLVTAVELCSLHQQYGWDPEQVVANALFADGAAAVVVRRAAEDEPASRRMELLSHGSCVIPETTDLMSWKIRDHGFQMTLSTRLPDVIRQELHAWLSAWLQAEGLTIADVAAWAIHPGGPRILSAAGDALGLSADQLQPSRDVLAECGNMSSPTVLFILERLRQQPVSGPCVLLGFGPGVTIEAALVRLAAGVPLSGG